MEGEDVIAWHYDQRGLFSVKSSYHVLEDNHEQQHQMQQGSLLGMQVGIIMGHWVDPKN
jgi:hypothetical protein